MAALTLPTQKTRKGRKQAKIRVPVKRTINLARVGEKKQHWLLIIPGIVLIVIAAAVFSKFLVVDRLQALYDAQSEVASLVRQIAETEDRCESYGELNDIYAHYTYSGMTAEELGRVDRVDAMELLEEVVLPRTEVDAWTLSGNTLTLAISGSTLEDINITVQLLLAEDLVAYSYVTGARTIEETLSSNEEIRDGELVQANLVIYLQQPSEEVEET